KARACRCFGSMAGFSHPASHRGQAWTACARSSRPWGRAAARQYTRALAPRLGPRATAGASGQPATGGAVKPTDISNPDTFHKVVDCQWAGPAHTPVPEYIRLIAAGRPADAYMVNWVSNVFPGILGRTCDRPCEPACRRGRVEENNGPPSM